MVMYYRHDAGVPGPEPLTVSMDGIAYPAAVRFPLTRRADGQ